MHLIIITLAALLGFGALGPIGGPGAKAGVTKASGGTTSTPTASKSRIKMDVQPGGGPS